MLSKLMAAAVASWPGPGTGHATVGDDRAIVVGVALALLGTPWLTRSGVDAWWLMLRPLTRPKQPT